MDEFNYKTIGYVVSHIVSLYGNYLAVIDETESLNYLELYTVASQLCVHLSDILPEKNKCIAVAGPHNVRTVVALLAIVLSGNYYVYADLTQPKIWLEQQLSRLDCNVMFYSSDNYPENIPEGITLLFVKNKSFPISAILPEISANQVAYVNFSSGSTGEPKAIACTHAGIVRLCQQQTFLDFHVRPVFLFHSPLSFDASTLEIWGPLLNGGCCIIHQEEMLTPQILQRAIHRYGVNTLWLTAPLFNVLVDTDVQCLNGLHTVLTGGDILSVSHVRKAFVAHPEICFVNGYGPTENTTFTCCHIIKAEDLLGDDIPIGQAITGTQVLLYDLQGKQIIDPGLSGEIYAFGEGLALGYLGDPERTAQAFVTINWQGISQRAYRTGDLACYDEEGNLHFIGRVDSQIKINGYRINLSEIESRLRNIPEVEDCILLVQQYQGSKCLVAVLQAKDDRQARQAMLQFPSWERPTFWLCVRSLPLTRHGKVDRQALFSQWQAGQSQPSATKMSQQEADCANWWSQLLGYPVTSLEHHFFESGGNSLHALRLLATCHQHYSEVTFSLQELYQHATLADFASLLTSKGIDVNTLQDPIPEGVLVL
ncbi:Amino acid adenylation [Xenorhabdus stockiae]|uniref:Amino acid adenylation n=1 Tax=Xenorhabdus stockiae TaxID=351614 RepID=A0A2D0KBD5_9GAMM|nr:non-ribosomal peptide synthetase [Xenorhabdus stockiae]PHM60713.1 Amino acid adenylation [Xenorhabdus stockiae]